MHRHGYSQLLCYAPLENLTQESTIKMGLKETHEAKGEEKKNRKLTFFGKPKALHNFELLILYSIY